MASGLTQRLAMETDRRLPAGRHALPREFVVRSQRDRILDAMAAACAERGYSDVSIADVVGRAQVSRKAFYDLFGDKEACFLAAFDAILARFLQETLAACNFDGLSWPDQMRLGIGAGLDFMAAEPEFTRMCMIDVFAVGPAAVDRHQSVIQVLAAFVDRGRAEIEGGATLTGRIAPALVEGAALAIRNEILSGRTAEVSRLLPALLYTTLVPFLGPEEALRHSREAAAAGSQARTSGSAPEAPDAGPAGSG